MPHPIWTGTEMIVWGGYNNRDYLNVGARYNPASDTWTPMSAAGAPEGRDSYSAVWTGTEMIIWGGWNSTHVPGMINTGGRYNPETDTWLPTTTVGAPEARLNHTAVWTGTRMIVWGGSGDAPAGIHQAPLPGTNDVNSGGIYDPATDTWSLTGTNLAGAPSDRYYHTAVWTGTEMIIWGGRGQAGYDAVGGRYDPSTDLWRPTSTVGAPSLRKWHAALWSGSEMLIWGGSGTGGGTTIGPPVGGGARYDPATDTWVTMSEINAPPAAYSTSAVWTGTQMIVWGGSGISGTGPFPGEEMAVTFGGRYDAAANVWTPMNIPAVARGSDGKYGHTTVWTGSEMIAWGGMSGDASGVPRNTGAVYVPSTDSWRTTTTVGAPQGRASHTAIWSGSEMIVWGGEFYPESQNNRQSTNTGARYNPATDTWTVTSIAADTPVKRGRHTAIWSGSEMIVWGGLDVNTPYNDGGRYNPATDVWRRTSATGAPVARSSHTAVWTGSKMIVWGGGGSSGGRYDPAADTWLPTSTAGAPGGNSGHTAVWTGSRMIVWGGGGSSGGRYDPAANSWQLTSPVGAPSARSAHTAVWTGTEMLVWGGVVAGTPTSTGGRYDLAADSWQPMSIPRFLLARRGHSAIWTGSSMVVFGGYAMLGPYLSTSATVTGAAYVLGPSAPNILSPSEGAFLNTASVTISGNATGGALVTVREGGLPVGSATVSDSGSWNVTHLFSEGVHSVTATASSGYESPPSAPRSFTVDTAGPVVAIDYGPTGTVASTTATFGFSASEPASFSCSLDGGAFSACASPATYSDLVDGSHTFSVRATDAAGNPSGAASRSWSIDSQLPQTTIDSGPSGTVASTSASFTFSSTKAGSVFACSFDAAAFTACVSPTTYTSLSEGIHTFAVRATDPAGRTGPSAGRTFVVDTSPTAPPVITSPVANAVLTAASVTISGTAEANSTVQVCEGATLLQTTVTNGAGAWTTAHSFSDGSHTITATATDAVGNLSATSAPRTFTVDTSPPAPPAIATPAQGAELSDSYVTLSGTSEPGARITLREGASAVGSVPADASGRWSLRLGLRNGPHTLSASATDSTGNAGAASLERAFTVADPTAPGAPTFTEPSQAARLGSTQIFVAGTAEPGAFVRVSKQGVEIAHAATNDAGNWRAVLTLPEGAHSLIAHAVDPAGNVGAASDPLSFEITVSPDAATPTITTPGTDSVQPGSVSITGTASVPAGTTVSMREGSVVLGTTVVQPGGNWSVQLNFDSGIHQVTAGVASSISAPRRFEVDAAPPSVAISTASSRLFVLEEAVIEGTATDNAGVGAIELRYYRANTLVLTQMAECSCGAGAKDIRWQARPVLDPGSYTVHVNAIDRAANRSAVRAISFVTI